jgi:hypothetical protein
MLAVCYKDHTVYRVQSALDAELELTTMPKGFGLWLFSMGHRPYQVLQVQARKALVSIGRKQRWVAL